MMRHMHDLMFRTLAGFALGAWMCLIPMVVQAEESSDEINNVLEMPLEELLKLEVYTASRSNTPMQALAAAVSVVTAEDIRRSGATSIPEALKAVPGVQVSRFDSNKWSVSIRGFSGITANKLLVMIDGRAIYTPQFAGTWWELHDVVMDDIERIEVIRGPGASLWGANAVNGVINILTKHASATHGSHVEAAYGSDEKSLTLRQGWSLGEGVDLRTYAKGFNRNNVEALPGGDDSGNWRNSTIGFRFDADLGAQDRLMLEGSLFREFSGNATNALALSLLGMTNARDDQSMQGGHLQARWKHETAANGELEVQVYDDFTHRQLNDSGYVENIDVFNLDLQHGFDLNNWNRLTWGASYTNNKRNTDNAFRFGMMPPKRSVNVWGMFIQDEMTLMQDRLRLTAGSKFEEHYITGFEIQPSLRAAWMPDKYQTYWAAVSRAVRTPSWLEMSARLNLDVRPAPPPAPPLPLLTSLVGNRNFQSEDVVAWEAGYRAQLARQLSVEAASFYNRYHHLLSLEDRNGCLTTTPAPSIEMTYLAQFGTPNLLCAIQSDNNARATTYGLELSADWRPREDWRLRAGYTWLHSSMSANSSTDIRTETTQKSDPGNQWYLQSSHDFAYNLTLDWTLRHVGASPGLNVSSYETLDAKLSWKPRSGLELSLIGRNLNDSSHLESGNWIGQPQTALPVVRDVFATIKLDF
jgi:iron complex outermembrane receptor protein